MRQLLLALQVPRPGEERVHSHTGREDEDRGGLAPQIIQQRGHLGAAVPPLLADRGTAMRLGPVAPEERGQLLAQPRLEQRDAGTAQAHPGSVKSSISPSAPSSTR